ncbi:MAG: hypothetical protein M3Q45_09210 [Chloroflexota bacterium]|nr:hypothetical protein [Chloroflexota bacterium]
MDIFVDANEPLTVLICELEAILNIKFQLRAREDETWYEHSSPNLVLTVGQHEFENDRDIPFENYQYNIALWPINYATEAEWHKLRNDAAQRIFQQLKATHKYRLLLVDDVQVKLAEFSPQAVIVAAT